MIIPWCRVANIFILTWLYAVVGLKKEQKTSRKCL
ncbi:Uncharacterized protein BM_BM1532 [Brugia malayi]|uniref:Bm1532 n=1 Tax=Brugia malayi TaxID=6279 RepID=A0A0K0J201_BRUMA|nr:Uncharacterized protein BM_BM1532 [Brugia malayi]CDQ01285.1 Bm1532 [Brugia malayi]VIO95439.1 Uncharacterized protein BM_BM1532 [Brugia malayi]